MAASAPRTGIDLYWLPLGAGGHSVRLNGKVYEVVAAWRHRRIRLDLHPRLGGRMCCRNWRTAIT